LLVLLLDEALLHEDVSLDFFQQKVQCFPLYVADAA